MFLFSPDPELGFPVRSLVLCLLVLLSAYSAQADLLDRWLAENADIVRAERIRLRGTANDRRHRLDELDDPALTRATRELGPTVISHDKLPFRSARANSAKKVWSSYWFPHYERDLFESAEAPGQSTLEKYDVYRRDARRVDSKAALLQKQNFSGTTARWEGLCDAWSIAAVLLPEPETLASYKLKDNKTIVRFSVGDQKALLLKSFEGISSSSLEIYGQRFHGGPAKTVDGQSFGWVQPDLYPDQFHRFLEVVLFERGQPFVLDHDPSEAVWSEPVDGANFEILPIPGRFDQVFVRAYIYPARQLTRDTRDQTGKNEHIREYNYILGGTLDWSRNLRVEYGIWLNKDYIKNAPEYRDLLALHNEVRVDSRRSHPDFVYVVPATLTGARRPVNPEIDPAFVDMIVKPAGR